MNIQIFNGSLSKEREREIEVLILLIILLRKSNYYELYLSDK